MNTLILLIYFFEKRNKMCTIINARMGKLTQESTAFALPSIVLNQQGQKIYLMK